MNILLKPERKKIKKKVRFTDKITKKNIRLCSNEPPWSAVSDAFDKSKNTESVFFNNYCLQYISKANL